MDNFRGVPVIPLSYTRTRNNQLVSGLTVTVSVETVGLTTNATLLSNAACVESSPGSGVYVYNWAHGIVGDVQCKVTYTVNGSNYVEFIYISGGGGFGGRTA